MTAPRPAEIRHRVDPGDVPAAKAARRMGLTEAEFKEKLSELLARGFPPADPTTGNYDLDAIDKWRSLRFPHLYSGRLTAAPVARDASAVINEARRIRGG